MGPEDGCCRVCATLLDVERTSDIELLRTIAGTLDAELKRTAAKLEAATRELAKRKGLSETELTGLGPTRWVQGGRHRRLLGFGRTPVLDKPLRRVVAEAGVPRITPHSFRRTYENLLRQSGVDDLVRRSVAG